MPVTEILLALGLTQGIELAVTWLVGFRGIRVFIAVILVNLITNPALNIFIALNNIHNFIQLFTWQIWLLEMGIVLAEGLMLAFTLKKNFKSMLFLSFLNNSASYLAGVLWFK